MTEKDETKRSAKRAVGVLFDESDWIRLNKVAKRWGVGDATLVRMWIIQKLNREDTARTRRSGVGGDYVKTDLENGADLV